MIGAPPAGAAAAAGEGVAAAGEIVRCKAFLEGIAAAAAAAAGETVGGKAFEGVCAFEKGEKEVRHLDAKA